MIKFCAATKPRPGPKAPDAIRIPSIEKVAVRHLDLDLLVEDHRPGERRPGVITVPID